MSEVSREGRHGRHGAGHGARSGEAPGARAAARSAFERRLLEVAKARLASDGAAGLGMRAVARDLEVTPGALYRYVAGRDELLTMLILDAYGDLARAVTAAAATGVDPEARWRAIWRSVRGWALDHRHEFALIYGSPVPGYAAPASTVEVASTLPGALADIALELLATQRATEARASGTGAPEPRGPLDAHEAPVPRGADDRRWRAEGALRADLDRVHAWVRERGGPQDVPDDVVLVVIRAWAELIGSVSFELFGHFVGSMESGDAYLDEVAQRAFRALCAALGARSLDAN